MDNQTKISETGGPAVTASNGVMHDMGEFAHDVLTLTELQTQLLIADVQEFCRRAFVPGLILVGGVALGLSCIPFALAALALTFVEFFEISYAVGFLLAVVSGAVLSAILCALGWIQVRKRFAVLQRSRQELVRNLRWIKKVLERRRKTRKKGLDNS